MGTTTRGYPYPESSDPPDGAAQVQALAEAVDTDTADLDGRVTIIEAVTAQSGTVVLTWSSSATATAAVTFLKPYASPPAVVVSSENRYRIISVSSVTTTGCNIVGQTDADDTPVSGSVDGSIGRMSISSTLTSPS